MNKLKHTPGPWTFRHYEWLEETSDDFGVFSHDGEGGGIHVADITHVYKGERQPGIERANARLIAAATDLLEALQMAKHEIETCRGMTPRTHLMPIINAAIAKATTE